MSAASRVDLEQTRKPLFSTATATVRKVSARETRRGYKLPAVFSRRLFDLFCFTWIVPIAILLDLNFRNWVVGAGVGCRLKSLRNDCYVDLLAYDGPDNSAKTTRLDQLDHEILGALQLVAKALEVWFAVIATSLVYDLTILLARQARGLPIAYLLTHVEFGDISTLFDRIFWQPSSLFGGQGRQLFFAFAVLVALLCITSNLMGPATAVLVIPTLGWIERPAPNPQRFETMAAHNPPINANISRGCNGSALASGNYSCTNYYSPELDKLSETMIYAVQEERFGYGTNFGTYQEEGLTFTFNVTTASGIFVAWAPSRQVLRELSRDFVVFQATQGANTTWSEAQSTAAAFDRTLEKDLFDGYRNLLDVTLHRRGPTLGLGAFCFRSNVTQFTISEDKFVRCFYANLALDDPSYNGYRCIRVGSKWTNGNLTNSQFSLGNSNPSSAGNVSVSVYSEIASIYFPESPNCILSNDCDWEALFPGNLPTDVYIDAENQQYVEYGLPRPEAPNATVVCYSNIYLIPAVEYNVAISSGTNTLGLVNLIIPNLNLSESRSQPIPLHPDWVLAGWAVPISGTVDGTRAGAVNFVNALRDAAATDPPRAYGASDPGLVTLVNLHFASLLHALTLVDYATVDATENHTHGDDLTQPLLSVSRTLRVWAYGHSSHTFRVGMAVTIFGCICVLFRLIVGCFVVSKHRCTVEFLAAALRYRPNVRSGEIDALRSKNKGDLAKVVVRIVQRDQGSSHFDLVPPQGNREYELVGGSA